MRNSILLVLLGFVLAYVLQEFRLQRTKKVEKKKAGDSLRRITQSILSDVKAVAGATKAEIVAKKANAKVEGEIESQFCCA